MTLDELLTQLAGNTKYTINYYGDGKLIYQSKYSELPKLDNVEASFEDVADVYYTEYNSVIARVVNNETKKVVAEYNLQ